MSLVVLFKRCCSTCISLGERQRDTCQPIRATAVRYHVQSCAVLLFSDHEAVTKITVGTIYGRLPLRSIRTHAHLDAYISTSFISRSFFEDASAKLVGGHKYEYADILRTTYHGPRTCWCAHSRPGTTNIESRSPREYNQREEIEDRHQTKKQRFTQDPTRQIIAFIDS